MLTSEKAYEHLLTRRAPGSRRASIQDDATGAVLFDLGYADYYGSGVGFRWALDATSLESGAAEDGGLVFIDAESGRTYYY